jgi:hypothetical protein
LHAAASSQRKNGTIPARTIRDAFMADLLNASMLFMNASSSSEN